MRELAASPHLTEQARDERGSAPVEFILVSVLLTALTLGVLQFALAMHCRNIVQDAAVDAAFYAALADTTEQETQARARSAVEHGVGRDIISSVTVYPSTSRGITTMRVRIEAALPVFGLLGPARGTVVIADAPYQDVG